MLLKNRIILVSADKMVRFQNTPTLDFKSVLRVKPPVGGFDSHTPPPPVSQGRERPLLLLRMARASSTFPPNELLRLTFTVDTARWSDIVANHEKSTHTYRMRAGYMLDAVREVLEWMRK